MYKKRVIFFIVIILLLTGCTRIDSNIDNIVNVTINDKNNRVNTVSTGYELYLPIGVMQVEDNDYNQKLKIKDTHVYLYVDTVSYYYKYNNYKFNSDYNYYYREINYNNKIGYIGINKLDDNNFYVEMVYNYSKIEFYCNEENMSIIISNCLTVLNSIKYNDNLIGLKLDNNIENSREVKYELDKPKDSESTFSQYLQELVEEEKIDVVLPDSE